MINNGFNDRAEWTDRFLADLFAFLVKVVSFFYSLKKYLPSGGGETTQAPEDAG